MKKFLFVGLLLVLILAACGGGDDKAPVKMSTYKGDAVSIEYPKGWKDSSMEMLGMTIGIFSPKELGQEVMAGLEDPFALLGDDPLVLFLFVPQEMAADMGIDVDDMMLGAVPEEEDVTIIRQGDITISGAKGKEIVGKGSLEELGGKTIGLHVAVAVKDDGSAIMFVGMTPEKDLDKNLDIFKYMIESVDLK